jgi:hypothetical protein
MSNSLGHVAEKQTQDPLHTRELALSFTRMTRMRLRFRLHCLLSLPSPLHSLAPVRPPMPSHWMGSSCTVGGAYGSSSPSPPDWVLKLTNRIDRLEHHLSYPDQSMISSATAHYP